MIRDGVYNTGGKAVVNSQTTSGPTNFGGSTIAPANFNTEINENDNSQLFGSSITSTNNDITKFRESTGLPDNFRLNLNTNGNTFNSQGITSNQNNVISTSFVNANAPNAIAPTSFAQDFNNQGLIKW